MFRLTGVLEQALCDHRMLISNKKMARDHSLRRCSSVHSAALPEQGGEMAVGNSPPLNRVIPTIYTEQDISKNFDILSNDQDIFVYFNVQRYSTFHPVFIDPAATSFPGTISIFILPHIFITDDLSV